MLNRMEEKIMENRPQIRKIKDRYGQMSYYSYVKQKNRTNPGKHFQERKKEIIAVIKKEVTRLLGTALADEVEKQLKRNDSVSTAEHTAPIGTAHMLNAGLHSSVPLFNNADPRFRNLIILACSGVSFNNDLSFSRGFQFNAYRGEKLEDEQLPFFGRSVDPRMVLYAPAYTFDDIEEMRKRIDTFAKEGESEVNVSKMKSLIEDVYMNPHAFAESDYVDQLTVTNYHLWKKLFPSFSSDQIPNYIMLSQEKVLLELLLDYHIHADTPISRLIFDKNYHALIEKYFDGIIGAFKSEKQTGTFLFWGLNKEGYRMQLGRDGDKLITRDGSYSVSLTPEAIESAIRNKELIPSLLLTFIVLSFYYGLLLGGGASQTTYLTDMKEAYMKMTEELGDTQSHEESQDVVTDDFVFFRPHLAFVEAGGERVSASGMDMYLYQDPENWRRIIQATKSITIGEFMTILLPILYKQFCPEGEREDDLMNISRADVERFTGFDKKLPVLGKIF